MIVNRKDRWFATEAEAEAARKLIMARKAPPFSRRKLDEFTQAEELLEGVSVLDAVRFFLRHRPTINRTTLVNEAVADFWAKRIEGPGRSRREKYKEEFKRHLKLLSDTYGIRELTSIGRQEIEAMLEGKTPYVMIDRHRMLSRFFRWAKAEKLVIGNPCDRIDLPDLPTVDRRHWTTEEADAAVTYCKAHAPDMVAAFAIQLYTGIRQEEVIHLDWSEVKGERIFLSWTKTGPKRVITFWPPKLTAAIEDVRQDLGRVAPKNYMRRRQVMLSRAGIDASQNILRHTYATFGLSLFRSADLIALQMGTSAKLVMKTYAGAVAEPEVAMDFFGVTPSQLGQLGFGASVHFPALAPPVGP